MTMEITLSDGSKRITDREPLELANAALRAGCYLAGHLRVERRMHLATIKSLNFWLLFSFGMGAIFGVSL